MILANLGQYFFGISIFVSSVFLVLLVLVQRGRGGGLTGALGGPGGQSAFGTKAGDLFTRITICVAAVWIFLCASSVFFLRPKGLPSMNTSATNNTGASTISGSDETTGTIPPVTSGTTDAADQSAASDPAPAVDAEITELPGDAPAGDPAPTTTDETAPTDGSDPADGTTPPAGDDSTAGDGN